MSDLIERLKALPWHEPAISEAVDEIERLTASVEEMQPLLGKQADEIERLNAKVDSTQIEWMNIASGMTQRIAQLEDALDTLHAAVFLSGNDRGKTFQETITDYHKQRAALQEVETDE